MGLMHLGGPQMQLRGLQRKQRETLQEALSARRSVCRLVPPCTCGEVVRVAHDCIASDKSLSSSRLRIRKARPTERRHVPTNLLSERKLVGTSFLSE